MVERDEEAIRRSRAQAFDHVLAEQWVTAAPAEDIALQRKEYIEFGWRPDPDNPKIPWSRETARSMKPDGN